MDIKIGERIRMHRMLNKMSRADLGKRFDLSEQAIGMYERGEREPNIEVIKKLASLFGVSTDYLLGHEPVTSSEKVWSIINLSDEEILNKITFTMDDKIVPKQHAEWVIQQIRAIRNLFPEE